MRSFSRKKKKGGEHLSSSADGKGRQDLEDGVSQIQGMLAGTSVVIWEGLAGVLPPSPAHDGNLSMEIIMEIMGDVEHGMETPTDQASVVSPGRDTGHGLRYL